MNPCIRLMLRQVWPIFWPFLFWNLLRARDWHARTGRDALIAVDRFGNIHFLVLGDEPAAKAVYSYTAPLVPRWARPALASDKPLLPGEKGLGMRGRIIAACAALSATPSPLTPAPLPRERGVAPDVQVRGPP